MSVDEKFLKDVERADSVERKAITQVMNLSKLPMDDVLWTEDSGCPEERRKRDFRVVFGDVVVPFEVKADFMSKETGNIALEYECRGRASGLASTGSAVWVQMVPFCSGWRMYFARVSELRRRLMVEMTPGIWRPNRIAMGRDFEKLASNRKSGDSNPSMSMILGIESHVSGRGWWMDAEKVRRGSIDWRLYVVSQGQVGNQGVSRGD